MPRAQRAASPARGAADAAAFPQRAAREGGARRDAHRRGGMDPRQRISRPARGAERGRRAPRPQGAARRGRGEPLLRALPRAAARGRGKADGGEAAVLPRRLPERLPPATERAGNAGRFCALRRDLRARGGLPCDGAPGRGQGELRAHPLRALRCAAAAAADGSRRALRAREHAGADPLARPDGGVSAHGHADETGLSPTARKDGRRGGGGCADAGAEAARARPPRGETYRLCPL